MERLTEWTGERWIARQERLNGKMIGDRDVYNRLADYEDTGLTPEEVTELAQAKQDGRLALFPENIHAKIMDEWIKAHADGRLVVLPYKERGISMNLMQTNKYFRTLSIVDHLRECTQKYDAYKHHSINKDFTQKELEYELNKELMDLYILLEWKIADEPKFHNLYKLRKERFKERAQEWL